MIRFVEYTDFDLPSSITRRSGSWTFKYDAAHNRVRKNGPAGSTIYFGDLYEKRTTSSGTTHVMYVPADGGRIVAQATQPGNSSKRSYVYLHEDHLGSMTTLTNGIDRAVRMAFEPFGGRVSREAPPTSGAGSPVSGLTLGFAGQEQEDDLGFVNMNGRIYDPLTARFLTADPLVASPLDTQGFNRYSYAMNSPLRFVDPTGFSATGYRYDDTSWEIPEDIDWGNVEVITVCPNCTNFSVANLPVAVGGFCAVDDQLPGGGAIAPVYGGYSPDPAKAQPERSPAADYAPPGGFWADGPAKAGSQLDRMRVVADPTLGNLLAGVGLGMVMTPEIAFGAAAGGVSIATRGVAQAAPKLLSSVPARVVNAANHIFGPKSLGRHNLGGVLNAFKGDATAAFYSLENAAQALANQGAIRGVFQTTVEVAGSQVTVRGAVIDGIAQLSTAFIP
jgi:RHS repeat-associated protein